MPAPPVEAPPVVPLAAAAPAFPPPAATPAPQGQASGPSPEQTAQALELLDKAADAMVHAGQDVKAAVALLRGLQ